MSRTKKDTPRKVLADRGESGWHWCHYGPYRFPTNFLYCGCGKGHGVGKPTRRCYWKQVRARVRDDLIRGVEPEPTHPRRSIQYMIH